MEIERRVDNKRLLRFNFETNTFKIIDRISKLSLLVSIFIKINKIIIIEIN